MSGESPPALLVLKGITKRFGRVTAVEGATLPVAAGEVHALLGENGAGKSTLMQVAAGGITPDAGTILLKNSPVQFRSPRDARRAGIGLVHQHFAAVPALTVAENVALAKGGRAGWRAGGQLMGGRAGRRAGGRLNQWVRAFSEQVGLPLDPTAIVRDLPVALQQRLEIVKVLAGNARILLLDEPTAVLAPSEAVALLERARQFASDGGAVVLITHRLDEALAFADRITVMRRGRVVLSRPTPELSAPRLVEAMIGDGRLLEEPIPAAPPGVGAPYRIRCGGLAVRRTGGPPDRLAVTGAWVGVRAGEIVTIAGVEGNGQRELLRALAGILPVLEGTLEVARPLAFIPEDRIREGLILDFSLTENVVLGGGDGAPWNRGALIDWRTAQERTADILRRFDVRATSPGVAAATLSGGNQQKLVLGRALERRPLALIAENPTRGLDVQATRAIHDELRAAAAEGTALLVYSSDLDEVLRLGQRVLVMSRGYLHEVPEGSSREEVGRLMLAGKGSDDAA